MSYKSKETISLESQLKDFIDVRLGNKTKSDIMRKYGISSSTYKKYKQRFVYEYGVDPRLLYEEKHIIDNPKLQEYCKEENLDKPIGNIVKEVKSIDEAKNGLYLVKGKCTLYDEEGNVRLTWVKESLDDKAIWMV